jgi:hypothetical protein
MELLKSIGLCFTRFVRPRVHPAVVDGRFTKSSLCPTQPRPRRSNMLNSGM